MTSQLRRLHKTHNLYSDLNFLWDVFRIFPISRINRMATSCKLTYRMALVICVLALHRTYAWGWWSVSAGESRAVWRHCADISKTSLAHWRAEAAVPTATWHACRHAARHRPVGPTLASTHAIFQRTLRKTSCLTVFILQVHWEFKNMMHQSWNILFLGSGQMWNNSVTPFTCL